MTAPTDIAEPGPEGGPAPRRRHAGRCAALALLALMAAALVGLAVAMVDRPVAAPAWLRVKIEERIAATLPGIEIRFGRMSLLVQRSGLARVILWDVDIRNARGEQVAALSDIEAGLAPGPLLRGQLVLKEAQVSGAFVTVKRDVQGRLGLALGDVFAEDTRTPDLPQIVRQVDTLFQDPRLAGLRLVEADALTLRYEDARARRGWTADGGRLRLAREAGQLRLSGDLALLGGGAGVAAVELNAASPIGEDSLDFGIVLSDLAAQDIATQSPALAWLRALDAPISGALRSRLDADGALGPLNATLRIGEGVLQPNLATRALPFEAARAYFTYDPGAALLRFDEVSVRSPLGQVTAEGKAQLVGLDSGWPTRLTGQFRATSLEMAEGTLLDRALVLSAAEADLQLQLEPFTLQIGRVQSTDPALPVTARGTLYARPDGWELALDARLARTDRAQLLSYWPETALPRPRAWVADHVRAAELADVTLALRSLPGAAPHVYLDAAVEGADVAYNPRLPALGDGAGRLTIDGNRLALRLSAGTIRPGAGGAVDLAGSTLVIPDLRAPTVRGELALSARGSLTAALAYLDNEAWQLLSKVGRDATLASGAVTLDGRITMPLVRGLKLSQVDLALDGVLREVASDTLVRGHSLRAARLDLAVSNDEVEVAGPVTLSGVAARGTWRQPLRGGGMSRVRAEVTLNDRALRAFGVTLPQGLVSGEGQAALSVDLPAGRPPEFRAESDLAGLSLSIPQIGWTLPRRGTGRLAVAGRLGTPVEIDRLELTGAGLRAEGRLALTASGGFEALELSRLEVGSWLASAGRLVARGPGAAPGVALQGGTLDLRRAPFGATGGDSNSAAGGGGPVRLALDRLQVTDSIVLDRFRGDFDTARGLRGQFSARLGGVAPIDGQVLPWNGGTAFRIDGEDAGDILKAANLLRTVKDGRFRLDMTPVPGQPGTYDGQMRIEGTRLQKAPAIGALLDAISIVGLLDQLNGPGIYFSEVEAEFRLTPGQVILSRSSAVGPSMGISLDGYYDLASGQMDMQGVLSPIYMVNAIGRLIARKGEGLIGFNFNLKGTAERPRVLVNPLSVFTPGMFRDIFRRPPPKVTQ